MGQEVFQTKLLTYFTLIFLLLSSSAVPVSHAYFVNGGNVSIILGQPDILTTRCGTSQIGICSPSGITFEKSGNLWVSDAANNRILEFNPPIFSGEAPTLVIGQQSFTSYVCATNQVNLCTSPFAGGTPIGLTFDKSGNLWVADQGNGRILRFSPPFSTGEPASLVIGEPNFSTSGFAFPCSASQSTLCDPTGVTFDKSGNLWVVDDNRVVRFNAPFTDGESASVVIGQSGFSANACTFNPPTAQGLCNPQALSFDSTGNLWVTDEFNNRVLRFDAPFSSDEPASVVIGEPDFTTIANGCPNTQSFCTPGGIGFDRSGSLWVTDYQNCRVLRFNPPFSNGEPASVEIGQSSFTTFTCDDAHLLSPSGVAFDASGNLWISEDRGYSNNGGNRILMFPRFFRGEFASNGLGQLSSFDTNTCADSQTGLCAPLGISFDKLGNLWVADFDNNRVVRFNAPLSFGKSESIVIGQPSFTTNTCVTTQSGLCGPFAAAVDSKGNLWVADSDNNRVLKFTTPFSSGELASLVIGQSSFATKTCATTKSGLCGPAGIALDKGGNLWVSDNGNSRVLRFNAPFIVGESASLVIGQTGFTSRTCATTQSGLCSPMGIAFDSKWNLWVVDQGNSRVLKFDSLQSTGESASIVLGQTNYTTGTCTVPNSATFAIGLCDPTGVGFDPTGNLWVADHANNRVFIFRAPFYSGEYPNYFSEVVIGQPGFGSSNCATSQSGLCDPFSVAFDKLGNLWVSDEGNSIVKEFT